MTNDSSSNEWYKFEWVFSYDLAMISEPENRLVQRFTGKGQEAVEITENFHGLLHSFTFVALSAKVN